MHFFRNGEDGTVGVTHSLLGPTPEEKFAFRYQAVNAAIRELTVYGTESVHIQRHPPLTTTTKNDNGSDANRMDLEKAP